MKLKLVHLSDLHLGYTFNGDGNYTIDRAKILFEGLKKRILGSCLEEECRYVIVITGDITDNARYVEFTTFGTLIQKHLLSSWCDEKNVPLPKIFVCIGNHDVGRDGVEYSELKHRQFMENVTSNLPLEDFVKHDTFNPQGTETMLFGLDSLNVDGIKGSKHPVTRKLHGQTDVPWWVDGVVSDDDVKHILPSLREVNVLCLHHPYSHREESGTLYDGFYHWIKPSNSDITRNDASSRLKSSELRKLVDSGKIGLILHGHVHKDQVRCLPLENNELCLVHSSCSSTGKGCDGLISFTEFEVLEDGFGIERIEVTKNEVVELKTIYCTKVDRANHVPFSEKIR